MNDQPSSTDNIVRGSPRLASIVVPIVLVALLLAAGAFAVVTKERADRDADAPPNWTPYVDTGKQAALNLTSVNHTTVDTDVQRILDSATGPFYDDFRPSAPNHSNRPSATRNPLPPVRSQALGWRNSTATERRSS